jgi:Fe2+ transport system protein FeoA
VQRLAALGFIPGEEIALPSADGTTPLPEWRILVFLRR